MSSVMHPVGPEQEQTYWWRRLIVIAAAVVLVGLLIALLVGGTSTGSAVSAQPSTPPSVPAPPSYTPSPYTTPTPTPTPSGTETAGATPSASGTPDPSASASASSNASASSGASPSSSAARSGSPTPSPKASARKTKTAPTLCAPGDLRATLTGKQRLRQQQDTTFALSLINGSGETCIAEVTPENFALTIYSGSDRIWSSADCTKGVEDRLAKLEAEAAMTWSVRWDGKRSRSGCGTRPEVPRPGTYVATAKLDGAKPVQLRMILRG